MTRPSLEVFRNPDENRFYEISVFVARSVARKFPEVKRGEITGEIFADENDFARCTPRVDINRAIGENRRDRYLLFSKFVNQTRHNRRK